MSDLSEKRSLQILSPGFLSFIQCATEPGPLFSPSPPPPPPPPPRPPPPPPNAPGGPPAPAVGGVSPPGGGLSPPGWPPPPPNPPPPWGLKMFVINERKRAFARGSRMTV